MSKTYALDLLTKQTGDPVKKWLTASRMREVITVLYDDLLNWEVWQSKVARLGRTQIVAGGTGPGPYALACYSTQADADAQNPMFEVQPNGVKIPAGTNGNQATSKDQMDAAVAASAADARTQLKGIVAASTDFANFKQRVVSW